MGTNARPKTVAVEPESHSITKASVLHESSWVFLYIPLQLWGAIFKYPPKWYIDFFLQEKKTLGKTKVFVP